MHIHFITGRLAEHALQKLLVPLSQKAGFTYSIEVLNITVAALMTTQWVADRVHVPPEADRVLLPGYCGGDLHLIKAAKGVSAERGPKDLRRLPEFFGQAPRREDYGRYDIEILAEINHAPRMTLAEILSQAKLLGDAGADLIDVGCDPGEPWSGVAEVVHALRGEGHRVSIDSLNPAEIAPAVKAGAELVLSVNSSNRAAALDWGCEVVVLPDDPATLAGLDETVEFLATAGVPLRIDPVLEPIGFGSAAILGRYLEIRRRYPDAEMLMGIGNITELTDADSASVNVLLLGICEELGIRSVLTTQVVHWARSSVRECDLARRLVYHAIHNQVLPKHLEPRLVPLRGAKPTEFGDAVLQELSESIKDHNYRVFAEQEQVHLISAKMHLRGTDPFLVFEELLARNPKNMDPAHAFYLGYEMAKAVTALTLNKEYTQDEALDWGFLTREETSHRLKRQPNRTDDANPPAAER
ncbi:MAG: DUF6513 domain-containing protein [Planctomycetota bacterium]|nr:DUF6513 domain-containing protein [Planctomycetota bacterium]